MKLNINNYYEIQKFLFYTNYYYYNKYNKSSLNLKKYVGGGSLKNINFTYKNELYKFHNTEENVYALFSEDENDCIILIIDSGVATINAINADNSLKCTNTIITNQGSFLLDLVLALISSIKDKFKLSKVELSDNSYIYCDNSKIKLANLSFLQYNNTWYGRKGFVPSNPNKLKNYYHNINILSKLKVKKLDIIKIFNNINDIPKGNKYDKIKDKIMKYYEKYNNELLITWFHFISKKYLKNNCNFFEIFIDNIFNELKLYSMHMETFAKYL